MELSGATIWVSRPAEDAGALVDVLSRAGARAVVAPLISVEPIGESADPVAVTALQAADWLVITSANAARWFLSRVPPLPHVRVAALGDATDRAVVAAGWRSDVVDRGRGARALADRLVADGLVAGKTFFYPCSEIASDDLKTRLEAAGAAAVITVPVYRTVAPRDFNEDAVKNADLIVFASGSAVDNLIRMKGSHALKGLGIVAIGATTASRLADAGAVDVEVADNPSAEGVCAAAIRQWRKMQKGTPS